VSIERLLATLERSAEVEAEQILNAARAEAARLAAEANERRRKGRDLTLAERAVTWRSDNALALAEARRRAGAVVAAAQQRLVQRVFAAVKRRFSDAICSDSYRAALPGHLDEALGYVGDRAAVVRCPRAIEAAVRALVTRRSGVTVEADDDAAAGIVVQTDDGALTVDATLEGRLAALSRGLALHIARAARPPE